MRRIALCLALATAAPALAASVRMEVASDGRVVFTNTGSAATRRPPSVVRRIAPAELHPLIEVWSQRHRVDPDLVHAVIRAESGYDPRAVSVKGAVGLMQLMPETARELAVDDPRDPAANIAGGTRYLRRMIDLFDGSLELALAGYNAGPEAVRRFGGVPPFAETRRYVERVLRDYRDDATFSLDDGSTLRIGRPVYLSRDASGRLVLSTVASD